MSVLCMLLFACNSLIVASAVSNKPLQISSLYSFQFSSYGTYLFLDTTLYATSLSYSSSRIDFLNASLGLTTNASQTFGLSVQNANATLSSISVNSTVLSLSRGNSGTHSVALISYYYDSGGKFPVEIAFGSKIITNQSYYTSSAAFDSSSAPSVYVNHTGGYIEIKTTTPVVVTIGYTLTAFTPPIPIAYWIAGGIAAAGASAAIVYVFFVRRKRQHKKLELSDLKINSQRF